MKIGVFISFCWNDRHLMDRIRSKLKKSEVLEPVVITERERADATLLSTEKVAKGIIQSKFFIPILTTKSIKNQWVNQEIGFASAKGKLIYPIIQDVLLTKRKLKGWVHGERDQPYQFKVLAEEKRSRKEFRNAYQPLLKVLEDNSKPIVLSKLNRTEKRQYGKGQIIFVNNESRHLLLNGYIYPLQNADVYREIFIMNGKREQQLTEREFNSYPIERIIE